MVQGSGTWSWPSLAARKKEKQEKQECFRRNQKKDWFFLISPETLLFFLFFLFPGGPGSGLGPAASSQPPENKKNKKNKNVPGEIKKNYSFF